MTPIIQQLDATTLRFGILSDMTGLPVSFLASAETDVVLALDSPEPLAPLPAIRSVRADGASHATALILKLTGPLAPLLPYNVESVGVFNTDEGALTNPSVSFTAAASARLQSLKALLPSPIDANDPVVLAMLAALAYSDDINAGTGESNTASLRTSTALVTAAGDLLDRCAYAYGVARPNSGWTDDQYRELATAIAAVPRVRKATLYALLDAAAGVGTYEVHEIAHGRVTVTLLRDPDADSSTAASDQVASSYFKADESVAEASNNFGDYLMADETVEGPLGRVLVWYASTARTGNVAALIDLIRAAGVTVTVVQQN